jgi:hypothetical protein
VKRDILQKSADIIRGWARAEPDRGDAGLFLKTVQGLCYLDQTGRPVRLPVIDTLSAGSFKKPTR